MSIFKNLMIDRVLDITDYDKTTGQARFVLPEVSDFSLNVTTNEDEITDATGSPVAILESAKQAELSGNSAFHNFELLAQQSAGDIETKGLNVPILEIKTIGNDGTVTLGQTPVGETGAEIPYIYIRNNDGTQGDTLEQDTEAASATAGANGKYSVTGKTVTFDSSLAGKSVYIPYTYAATNAMYFASKDDKFTTSSRIVVRILVRNVCNDNEVTVLTIVSDNAKLTSAFDLTFARGESHPFTYRVMPAYCGATGKNLYEMYLMDSADYTEE